MPPATVKRKASKPRVLNCSFLTCVIAVLFGLGIVLAVMLERHFENEYVATLLQDNALFINHKETSTPISKLPLLFPELVNYTDFARAYNSWPIDTPFPCFPTDGDKKRPRGHLMSTKPASTGLLFHRPVKTGSTTVAGTVMRIAHRKVHLLGPNATRSCLHRANHGSAFGQFQYHLRDKSKSFLFSIIREPTKRSISKFFHFTISVAQKDPTDAFFQEQMMSTGYHNHYIRDLALQKIPLPKMIQDELQLHKTLVEDIIKGYDFIGITERLDESLVVFKMLMHLDLEDILYVRERSQGGFSNGPPTRPCLYLWPSFLTKGMKEFFQSEQWRNQVRGDYMLYDAARKSLDLTIDRLGRDKFDQELVKFKAAQMKAEEICAPRAVSMCREDGSKANVTTCYIWGEGCSHECLDEIKISDNTPVFG